MENDISTLWNVFASPHLDTQITIDDFVSRVEETTSCQFADSVRKFFIQNAKGEILLGETKVVFCDGVLLNAMWRKRPLRFELVHANNVDVACIDATEFNKLTLLREKRLQLQTQLSQILVCIAKKEKQSTVNTI